LLFLFFYSILKKINYICRIIFHWNQYGFNQLALRKINKISALVNKDKKEQKQVKKNFYGSVNEKYIF